MRLRFSSFVVLLMVLGTCLFSNAQIFHVQGGASTLFGADGGSIDIKTPTYDADIGAGVLDGHLQYGLLVRTKFMGDTLSVGDDTVKVELPTDVFDASHFFLARGVSLQHFDPATKNMWYGFAGTTSLGFSSPFFMASRSESGLGIFYYEHKVGTQLRFISRNLVSDRQTSIQALEWSAMDGVKLSASAGMGSNQPYFAAALRVDRENLAVRAAYIAEGDKFQRMQVTAPVTTEPEKENVAAVYRLTHHITVRGTHQNVLQPAIGTQPILRAALEEAFTDFNVAKFNLGAGLIDSRLTNSSLINRSNLGINTYATRAINRVISVNGDFYQSRPNVGAVSSAVTGTVREQVNQKLALTQTLVRSNGQTTTGFGGEYVGNQFNINVGYQTVYVPFRPDNPFQQALGFNVHVNLPRNMQLSAGSFVDPEGKIRYTVGMGTYLYRFKGMIGPAASAQSYRFPKFVVEGIVVDANGQPLEGAAIRVNGKLAYSDSDGRFMVRLDKVGPHPVSIALEEFTTAGMWEVVEAPATVKGQPEDEATPVRIVLRRVPMSKRPVAPVSTSTGS